jgi:hypothetical protein
MLHSLAVQTFETLDALKVAVYKLKFSQLASALLAFSIAKSSHLFCNPG